MATIDLTTLNWENGGANHKESLSTVNKEFKIPKWAKLVTIQAENQAIKFSYTGVDGVVPTADAFPQAVGSIIQYNPQQTSQDRYIYLASQTGTANAYFIFE